MALVRWDVGPAVVGGFFLTMSLTAATINGMVGAMAQEGIRVNIRALLIVLGVLWLGAIVLLIGPLR
jgi:hypothetical protein